MGSIKNIFDFGHFVTIELQVHHCIFKVPNIISVNYLKNTQYVLQKHPWTRNQVRESVASLNPNASVALPAMIYIYAVELSSEIFRCRHRF